MSDPFEWIKANIPQTPDEREATRANQEQMGEAALKQIEHAKLFADVFLNGRGPELLHELRACTIEVGLMDIQRSAVRGDVVLSPAEWAYVREGQNSIVRMIEEQIRIATTPVPIAPTAQTEGDRNE